MRQRSILPFGFLAACGLIGLASPVLAKSAPPVIRVTGFTPQVPLCYIEMTNSGRQNLDAACLMGKVPDAGTIDMVTDRDKDGVPDELTAFFKQMDGFSNLSDKPEVREAQAAQAYKVMKAFAQRTPLAPVLKANFNEMVDTMYAIAKVPPGSTPSSPQLTQRMQRMDQAMEKLNQDPFMQKVREYSNRYDQNKYNQYSK
jgi:hypothetical protein